MKTKTEQCVLDAATGFLEPLRVRTDFTTSRIAILKDGTPKAVLLLLAEEKMGGSIPPTLFPFWIDGDMRNETLANVDFAERQQPLMPRKKRPA